MRLKIHLFICMTLISFAGPRPVLAQALVPENHVQVSLIPEFTEIQPGAALFIAIRQDLDEGWHSYWRNAGDSGEPPVIKWHLPEGFETGPLHWPVPQRIAFGPLTSYGYEGTVMLVQELRAPVVLPQGPIEITADIEILVCKEICIPEYHKATFTLNDGNDGDNGDIITEAFTRMPFDVKWPARYSEDGDGAFILDLEVALPALITKGSERIKFDILPYEWGVIDNSADTQVAVENRMLRIVLSKKRGERPLDKLGEFPALITFDNLDTGIRHALEITAKPNPAWLAQTAAKPAALAPETTSQSAAPVTPPRNIGFAAAILFALLGGLILNLMPCVFPILSMKALGLVKMNEKSPGVARLHGIAYTAGILICFAVIAALLIALKAGGAQIGWGFQLQNPQVVLLLSYLLFVLGLNLSGFFEFGLPGFIGGKNGGNPGLAGSFMTGALATLVATPCTAPFMGAAMGYALVQPASVSLSVFLALGFGLALPYLTLSFIPALRAALPKPGPWMAIFRELLAFPLYASAIWLIWVYSQQTGSLQLLYALSGFIGISFAIWAFRNSPAAGAGRLVMRGFAFIVLLSVLVTAVCESHGQTPLAPAQETAGANWQSYTPERYAALQADNGAIFVNMTAAWCITCKINERVALDTKEVKDLFASSNIRYLKGDWTNQSADITDYLARYGRNGVPLYVYYGARDPVSGTRPEPVVLPQLLTPAIIAKTLKGEN